MTYPDVDPRVAQPIPVEVKNWAPTIKPPVVRKTTIKTYIVNAAGGFQQICDYEPARLRIAIYAVDSVVSISTAVPTTTPEASSNTLAPQGGVLFAGNLCYEFFGPDAFWLNSLGSQTRVTVIKEYGA